MSLADLPAELLPRLCMHPRAAAMMRCVCWRYLAAVPADLFEFSADHDGDTMTLGAFSPYYKNTITAPVGKVGTYVIVFGPRERPVFAGIRAPGWAIHSPLVRIYKVYNKYADKRRRDFISEHRHSIGKTLKLPGGVSVPDAAVYARNVIFTLRKDTDLGRLFTCMYKDACSIAVQCRPSTVFKLVNRRAAPTSS